MTNFLIEKGSRNASLFVAFIFYMSLFTAQASILEAVELSKVKTISTSATWLSLLHANHKKSYISDPSFLLSKTNYSSEAELVATINYLYSGDAHTVCRFPARYFWLQRQLNLPPLDVSACKELMEFEKNAPIDSVSLVFASENITQPSSMMGHVLIKISGANEKNIETSHAISFYTNIKGFNLPKILYQNIISGKDGYFSLSPYNEKLLMYNNRENRNVWEYELNVDSFHRKLLQYHFYELKQTNLTYFFSQYNCATLTQFILGVANDKLYPIGIFGTSPVDTIKKIDDNYAYKNVRLIPSKKWKLRMLSEGISRNSIKEIKNSMQSKSTDNLHDFISPTGSFIAYSILETHLEIQMENEPRQFDRRFYEKVRSEKYSATQFEFDLSQYKSPAKTPADSQVSIGMSNFVDDQILVFNVLPTAHKLEDDNRQYFGETSLTLGDISIAQSSKTNSIYIDNFTLYGVKSLIPHDYFSGGLSGSFRIGATQQYDINFNRHTKAYIDGAIGKTYGLGKDISIYGLIGGGISSTKNDFFGEATPEIGIIVKEILNMKSIIHYQQSYTDSKLIDDYTSLSLTQSLFINSNWGLFGKIEDMKVADRSEVNVSIWIKHYF